jgi:hypothetical protein
MFDPSEILPWLFIGSESAARSVVMRDGGSLDITHVLNVSDNMLYSPFSDVLQLLHVPMADDGTTVLTERLDKCFAFIELGRPSNWEPSRKGKPHVDSGLDLENRVLVHCIVGVNRSATIVIAYIMATYRWNLEDTLELVMHSLEREKICAQTNSSLAPQVRGRRPIIDPVPEYLEQLREFERKLGLADVKHVRRKRCLLQ